MTDEERCQIYALNKGVISQNQIAALLSVSQSTINSELSRNTGLHGHHTKQTLKIAIYNTIDSS
ncbi:helix-turn-helix domain-containing protein [Colwellia sp. 1_MG-2023]|uniref:helix-turn-helix domain-containing protein n=1 Tax=unclassified Colwellia TaxID=196834 RepID=UPI001C092D10|nr:MULTISPECIES: helix-turn-helix domain-containing protein [unclassified Colwellia]MBU2924193.1 helix-turn-helix domain-containing protein [Colwellia sp. C2M11]MDO6652083.1 helix-turn-helix domain-containing protein [Colwellia sp. 3_MG-2023]MDO6664859.1 helix-turn-helix domain-containing protein [Colwellia sp. 2_MG-2023]MDO6689099.1 helix-turn-helix domain-containing protein [Colwellia sp. 1_MG-2023]